LAEFLKKQASFWPVVGVLGMRQVGKSTLFHDLIGMCELLPMTLAEASESPFMAERIQPLHSHKPRFGIEKLSLQATRGGMPVPLFSRDSGIRVQYWKNWIATTLGRELARVYGRSYDSDFAEKVLLEIVRHHEQGIFPTVGDFKYDARRTKKYLNAFRSVFMVRSLPCH